MQKMRKPQETRNVAWCAWPARVESAVQSFRTSWMMLRQQAEVRANANTNAANAVEDEDLGIAEASRNDARFRLGVSPRTVRRDVERVPDRRGHATSPSSSVSNHSTALPSTTSRTVSQSQNMLIATPAREP